MLLSNIYLFEDEAISIKEFKIWSNSWIGSHFEFISKMVNILLSISEQKMIVASLHMFYVLNVVI